ncbi:MAG: hypothetical protein ABIO78_08895 [Thermoanaerobaculia bacterium]
MKRLMTSCVTALCLLALTAGPALAEVKTREKTQGTLGGMLGKMVNLFGGKAAKEGVVSTAAVKGNRKATMNESTGQIIDLSEEKVYDLDMKKKTYEVTTFEELRRRAREAREKAEKDAANQAEESAPAGKSEPSQPQKEYEVDFDLKETGQKKPLAGYDTREVVMTITVREKGRTLEDAGGVVMTSNSWLGPLLPAMKELNEFDIRYYKQLAGNDVVGISAEQMATVLAMVPAVKQAMDRLKKEGPKLQGTPLATTVVFEAVKSKAAMEQPAEKSSGGGLGGMLARKMAKKDNDGSPRSMIFTSTHEVQDVSTSVAPTDIAIPAGFKEKK